MKDLDEMRSKIVQFRDDRNWKQFHNPKDLAISLLLEAGEVLEHFQWMKEVEQREKVLSHKQEISEELADVFSYLLLLCNELNINLSDAFEEKLQKSAVKYPVAKSSGNHRKYTEL
jgi:NTP pyrophosphatase (non-canonical NTP hydrolase)